MDLKLDGKIICLVGGSGSGKSFYEKFLAKNGYEKLISHTTREIRVKDNEVNGVDYFFVTPEDFDKIDMLEYTIVKGNKYGLSMKELKKKLEISKTSSVVVVVEPNGLKQIIDKVRKENVISILVDIPLDERRNNMILRGDTIEAIEKRLENEDFVGLFYNLGLTPDVLIKERIENLDILLSIVSKELSRSKEAEFLSMN